MELLAPAGDEAALRAAVCAGADAVYLGYASFGARAAAANFDAEALASAIDYAHRYHVRVYVTVNTLVKENELERLFAALSAIYEARADAVIVQDMGVLRMARDAFPGLALHASTQMALHTAAGARFAAEQGVSRVVLARECTLAQAAAIAKTGVQTEVFVHGALCASVSGQCLLSSMAGGRSGNRGRCAQPCRQAVTLADQTSALLSMKDQCLRDRLPELQAAGVTSLKIEGRLKRPEYVAVVTQHYRAALDALATGRFRPMDLQEREALLQIFHRGGFTEGHLMGQEDADLCATERVGHGGLAIGKILSVQRGLATAALQRTLNDGDSLRVQGAADVELRYAGHPQAMQATLRLRPGETVRAGDALYRIADALQLQAAQALTEPAIPLWLTATVCAGEPIRLTATDGISTVSVSGDAAQTPLTHTMTQEAIARQLGKLGETPFQLQAEPQVKTDAAFAPVSALNALRRDALAALLTARCTAFYGNAREAARLAWAAAQASPGIAALAHREGSLHAAPAPAACTALCEPFVNTVAVAFSQAACGQDFTAAGANLLLYTPKDLRPAALAPELALLPAGAWVCLPPQLSDSAFGTLRPLLAAPPRPLGGVVLGSVGQLGFSIPLPVALGDGVPITNRQAALELLRHGVAFCTLWPELSREELDALQLQHFPSLLRVYGRERVMLLNHCPERVRLGLAHGRAACTLCKPEHPACASARPELRDRRGYTFPLLKCRTQEGCVVEVYNALPTDLARQDARRRALGAGMLLSFTTESHAEQVEITARFATLSRTGRSDPSSEPATGGHFLRGVE